MGRKEILEFTCPRWNDIPEIDLYMDQVVNLLEKKLSPLMVDDEKIVTSTMINNYVKQKIITPPQKKKYDRKQVACLFIIILMKKVFSVSEIAFFLEHINNSGNNNFDMAYNHFCDMLENSITISFKNSPKFKNITHEDTITETMTFAFACKLYAQTLLNNKTFQKEEAENE